MLVDILSSLSRGLGFIALFQAAGSAMFVALFGTDLPCTGAPIRRLATLASASALVLVSVHYSLEAGRMGGALSSVLDADLQRLAFSSPLGAAWMLRVLGLVLILFASRHSSRAASFAGLGGVVLSLFAFTRVGHTTLPAAAGWLSAALEIHVLIVAFWFGALWPLYRVTSDEDPQQATRVVERFSRWATACVPLIFAAGTLMMLSLIGRWSVLLQPYGAILAAKILGFALLMGLASLNKWRYGPTLALGVQQRRIFQRMLAIEFALIAAIVLATAVLTTFFSPAE